MSQLLSSINNVLKNILGVLTAIGSSTIPVPVSALIRNGNYAYTSLGAPSINSATPNQIAYSTPVGISGESLSVSLALFTTGAIVVGNDAYIFLEADLAGSTAYKQVCLSKHNFSDANYGGATPKSMVVNFTGLKGGNYRIGINYGNTSGSGGATGFNVSVIN